MAQVTKYIGLDIHKDTIAVAVAEDGRDREVRFRGTIPNTPEALRRLVARLVDAEVRLVLCYEAGSCGLGVQRLLVRLGTECLVVAPSTMPRRPGDRVKTDRRDAATLARLLRAGELAGIGSDEAHEAVRDLVRARKRAKENLREAKQALQASCCATSAGSAGGPAGRKRTGAGSANKSSPSRTSSWSSRSTSSAFARSRPAARGSTRRSRRRLVAGSCAPWSRRCRRCAGSRWWLPQRSWPRSATCADLRARSGVTPLGWTHRSLSRKVPPMPRTRPPYAPEFRRQMIELVRAGRDPADLAREFEPSAQAIRNWVAEADRQEGRRQPRPVAPALSAASARSLSGCSVRCVSSSWSAIFSLEPRP